MNCSRHARPPEPLATRSKKIEDAGGNPSAGVEMEGGHATITFGTGEVPRGRCTRRAL